MRNKKNKKAEIPKTELSANELTNVKDIKGNFLYSKDGYIFSYLKVHYFNLELLSADERRTLIEKMALSFQADHKNFDYLTLPREIDLDDYKQYLKKLHQGEDNIGKRRILAIMLQEAADLSLSGENYEHQHFIKIWEPIGGNEKDAKRELMSRLEDFKIRYEACGIRTDILDEAEIIKLCNLFGNSQQVAYMSAENTVYTVIPQMREDT
ncbi:MAG: hypothetical protein KH230_09720 [Enterocloster asparagiformis]|nr:hypothetical protein [Enterocloster asparagiformis]